MIITIGNQPGNEDGGSIYNLDSNGTLTHEFTMSEQGNMNSPLHMSSGEIIIGGTDPAFADDWTLGNIYVKKDGIWTKKRTLPNVIHTFGHCEHNGNLYVATGAHTGDNATWEGRVFWSDDQGDRWAGSALVNDYRIIDVLPYGGDLYATGYTRINQYQLYHSANGGETWQVVSGISPRPRHRMTSYDDKLATVTADLNGIVLYDGSQTETITPPEVIANNYNVIAVVGAALYVLCGAGSDHVYRYDGSAWHYHCDLGAACVSLLNFDDQFLVTSTMGIDAQILRIDL